MNGLTGRRFWFAVMATWIVAFLALAPTVADFGLTWDEPAYRHSQMVSIQWWERLFQGEIGPIMEPDALLYYWPYGRYGVNFHPPLAGQLNLLTYEIFGSFLRDIPARRMASVLEFSTTIALLFGFLARRYGVWVGGVAAGSLLLMPRLYGQAHLIDTDTPGLFLWACASLAFWKGLNEPHGQIWRVATGVLVGLCFVEKMGAVLVVLPMIVWLILGPLLRSIRRRDGAAWLDGVVMTTLMATPLILAYAEIVRLSHEFIAILRQYGAAAERQTPAYTDLFRDHPQTWMSGAFLLVPLGVWIVRRMLVIVFREHPILGRERPALEVWTSLLAFGPAIAWLGNPAWWRESLPRLAHYYAITTTRRGVLPDIQILYWGQNFEYSLPWHNAWVLIAITVPVSILIAALLGLFFAPWRDQLPLFFLLNLVILPLLRMLETPAHDGVRLFLPTFFFLAGFAGWGAMGLAAKLMSRWGKPALMILTLAPAAFALTYIHPFELSYYNEWIGGPRGAWNRGFELTYWYDAFTPTAIEAINAKLPPHAVIEMPNEKSSAALQVFEEQQTLGSLRDDLRFGTDQSFPYVWLLTHDSKADCFSRLLFAMTPFFAIEPRQLDGLRVATVADPKAASRAWALQLLLDQADNSRPEPPRAPQWVRDYAPRLARFWGDGIVKTSRLAINESMLSWAHSDPKGLRDAVQWIVQGRPVAQNQDAQRLWNALQRYPSRARLLLQNRPEALREAAEILIDWPDALRKIILRYGYTDPNMIGGSLDRDFLRDPQ